MQHILIYTLQNVSDEDVAGTYDGKAYAIPAGGTIDLPSDVAGWYIDKHPGQLERVSERTGDLAENADRATLTNITDTEILGRYDGEDFTFAPGVPVPMHESAAQWFMNTQPYIGKFELGIRQPDEVAAPAAPVADESTPDVPSPDPKPKKTAKKTKEAKKA